MIGIGPPLVTPFTADGLIDETALRDLVSWVESRGVDFLVPCGSNSEAELMTAEGRARVIEVVAAEASVPVLAGTGSPGYEETRQATAAAADAGADAALVVTPFYYPHDDTALEAYYRDLADEAEIPIYLYSVPAFTDVKLSVSVVEALATHPNIAGMKDSSGDIETFVRERRLTADADFDLLVGSGSMLSHALDIGADGGVLALANVAPEATTAIYDAHREGDVTAARERNEALVELNRAVTTTHGIPGLKAAMRARGAPVGHVRRPHQPVSDDTREELERLVASL
ncbi:dihydrodipicolinate synthase/n-acetylneuraminate lyase [Halogeometricum borinquense DSM 11551]|uniref:Dihydrodipicolinate synthase/N-acetylneuraminate lyase n=1 Tax=Halogeometricum borinquense (strain ATCC 700274 / DSM 11551 / JCM 10706 / KCTC 4070 / PR3) TaxID=469382 RepID=E4NLZ5_HALBP|nr:dihydrodipicolinate synthase family protein [Halogeometricum borinquense]ADQ66094.1 dihydrodipicolinate synthase/N-acetylneuraminate lyase [Halogeometricum borinquense DSM 11551]ELY27410.1 dihydrodipicolinate synthase/n-acetylneuraminate lyase [Halogeometricum borinquense DSM 11551]